MRKRLYLIVVLLLIFLAANSLAFAAGDQGQGAEAVRFATFNASLNRNFAPGTAGSLVDDLSTPANTQAQTVAEIIQRTRPEVLLLNEFDYDDLGPSGSSLAAQLFQDNYLSVPQNTLNLAEGGDPIYYPYRFVAPSNTGIHSGFDLDNNGLIDPVSSPFNFVYAGDSLGFGWFPGQFGMAVLSMYPIDAAEVRTFQTFLWKDMPSALLPFDPATGESWYSEEELEVFRLSSKSHWDIPVEIGHKTVHFLVSHPTPPVFDDPPSFPPGVDFNGRRNHDEIRFWADYISPGQGDYIYDDAGNVGGLKPGSIFVIAGDQNSDPYDGDSIPGSAQLLLDHPLVSDRVTPSSQGGVDRAAAQPGNETHIGNPAYDTADFSEPPFGPGNLRADYVLPFVNLRIVDAGVFWPADDDPLSGLTGTGIFGDPNQQPSSDHRLVWIDASHGGFQPD
jgi:3-phytase/alkaline phosphatase D